MPRSIWSGSLSFGLVNVPVKLVTAVRSKDVRFNQLHAKDGARIEYKKVCAAEGVEVPSDEIVKGFRVGPDEYVTLDKEELEQLAPEETDAIAIEDFVDLADIDPIYFEHPYYLVPEKGAAKAYRLLLEAMKDADKVAVARVVMRGKEHLVAVRPIDDVLTMTKLLWADELVDRDELEVPEAGKVGGKELDMAHRLIEALSGPFEPAKYTDTHREQVLALIEAKAEGREVVAPPKVERRPTADLAEALAASLEAVKGKGRGAEAQA